MVLPLCYWSASLIDRWKNVVAQKPQISLNFSTAPSASLVSPVSQVEARQAYTENPLRLLQAATLYLQKVIQGEDAPDDTYVGVYTNPNLGGAGVSYGVTLLEKTLKPNDHISLDDVVTTASGIRIVAEGKSLVHLAGKIIDFVEGPITTGLIVIENNGEHEE
jgi:Fe-S cluster assembly iron-binding protein IscA